MKMLGSRVLPATAAMLQLAACGNGAEGPEAANGDPSSGGPESAIGGSTSGATTGEASGGDSNIPGDGGGGTSSNASGGVDAGGAEPVDEDLNPWEDQTFVLTIRSGSWSEPPGVGADIDPFVPDFVLSVGSVYGGSLEVTIGTAVGGQQDFCNPTVRVLADAMYPNLSIGPIEFSLHIAHVNEPVQVSTTVHAFTLTNVLPEGDSPAEAGELGGVLDMRDLYPLFTALADPSPDVVCDAISAALGSDCQACPTDGESYCLTVRAGNLGAEVAQTALEPIGPDELAPSCLEAEP